MQKEKKVSEKFLTKSSLIERVAVKKGLSKDLVDGVVSEFLEEIRLAILNGNKIRIVGYLSLDLSKRASISAFNPRTRKAMVIPEQIRIKIKAGQRLKMAARNSKDLF